ncbi:CD225/dispanin family protein [Candidatus Frankia alpina]|uniref:CD225/dispanin family protein n=1 Tax=Candidatus Frankia alpina TaxID=2699483 RepID=A0A4S5EPN3_9ACTN|nr:CD225/dispanin family protein [Candidatus Frankia alpina]THJ74053.1 CD225/dispanin family protein [Candidatus Frankia alpina]
MSSPPGGERPDRSDPGPPSGWDPYPDYPSYPGQQAGSGGADRPIRTYLWQSLVATLLCCLPTGIVAIVYATQAQTRLQAGDLLGARQASGRARRWCIVSLIAFAVVLLVVVAIVIIVAIASRND